MLRCGGFQEEQATFSLSRGCGGSNKRELIHFYGDIHADILSYYVVGGFNPSEKYESQLGLLFPIYGKS